MGRPMARNLLRAGYSLTVYNRSRGPVDELAAEGAAPAGSPAELAAESDVIITIVTDSPDVEEVIAGERGVIHGARPGSAVIDMSTISPKVARELAARLAQKGVAMLDAPV
ncbi:MAG: NAD(P)-binding domain-containing protein, partial [Clostridia bacterium]